MHRILNERKLKLHKVEYWCVKSPDPEFAEKQAAILGLYLDPLIMPWCRRWMKKPEECYF